MQQTLSLALCFVLISCTGDTDSRSGSAHDETQAPVAQHGMATGSYQYCYVTADDTAILSLRITEDGVSGSLLLQYFGKERSDGRLENARFSRDTLIADYRYWSDSGKGLREVMFLIREGIAREAYGAVRTTGDKQMFSSHKSVAFNSPPMSLNGCGQKVPTFRKE